MLSVQGAYAASSMPAGVQSFAPAGVVPDNVSFRVVFRQQVVARAQTGKTITPENALFPFDVKPPLQLKGTWQNERTFTAKLFEPLSSATTYTATLRDSLKDIHGETIGPGTFTFQTEGKKSPGRK